MNPPQDLMDSVSTTDNEVRKLKRFVQYLEKYAEEKGVISFASATAEMEERKR